MINFQNRETRTEKIEMIDARIADLKSTPMTFAAIIVPTQNAIKALEAQRKSILNK